MGEQGGGGGVLRKEAYTLKFVVCRLFIDIIILEWRLLRKEALGIFLVYR